MNRRAQLFGVTTLVLGLAVHTDPAFASSIGTAASTRASAVLPAAAMLLAAADQDTLDNIDRALASWDLPKAERLAASAGTSIEADVKRGVVLVYQARYAEGEAALAEAIASGKLSEGTAAAEEAVHYLALSRGAQKALDGSVTVLSEDGFVEAVFADGKDAILAPYLFEAMTSARTAIGDVIGIQPTEPVRFEFLDNPAKLAMVTPLTTQNIRTTGTVGVTKYRRIMMISPRVMVYGYGWLDTAVHEYVHYVLTMRTDNQAPVWLQEGLAKLLETRWRRTDPDPLAPPIAYRLHKAIVDDDLVTLAEMYPSVAMLPSAERAALAYAEVETMLGLLHERKGNTGVEVLLDAVADGDDAEAALSKAWGGPFENFMKEWKRVTKARTARGRDGDLDKLEFKDGGDGQAPPLTDVFSDLGGGKARQHARLGTLLQVRGHAKAATLQYEKARSADKRARTDVELSTRLGRLYVELGEFTKAVPLLDIAARNDPENANLAAAQGRALLRTGDIAGAKAATGRALRNNPFIPTLHCDLADLADDDATRNAESIQCKE